MADDRLAALGGGAPPAGWSPGGGRPGREAGSRLKLDNEPGPEERAALRALVVHGLDPLRDLLGVPMIVSSGYRCASLNRAIGGTATSQHIYGEAAGIGRAPGRER